MHLIALVVGLVAADPSVTFDVKKGGDVKWKGACTADVFDLAGDGSAVSSGVDVDKSVPLAAGKYEAVIACNSDDGLVKRTVAFTLKSDEVKVPVALEPGFLLVNVLRFDTPVRAELAIFDDHGREIAASKDKAVIPVCPGKVSVLAKVHDDKAPRPVLGTATANVTARQKSEVTVDTTDGELTVFLTDNGKRVGGVAALRAPGQKTRLMELHAGEKGAAPPGTYDLVTQLDDTHDFSEVVTKGVQIAPGKAVTRTVAHWTATIRPQVLVDGRTPAADAKIDVELSTPGAAAPFNTAALGDALKVAAGTFELTAVQKDGARDDGTTPQAKTKVTVHPGEVRGVTLAITSAHLDVTTTLGGKAKALDVELTAPGGGVSVAKKTSGVDGRASFAVAPAKYGVKAILHAAQGDVVAQRDVTVGEHASVKLDVNVGTAVVQVFEAGVSVPAEVRFFAPDKIKDNRPVGDALLSVPAGAEALVAPGTYSLVVIRKGDTHVFSDLKVAAGRTVERTVEIK